MQLANFKEKLIESLIGNVLMFGLNLIFPMVISRIYGVETYGSYVYGITIISIALFMANLGMDVGLLYYIPKTGNRYVTSSFVLNVFTSALAMLIIHLFMPRTLSPYLGLVWLLSAEQLFFSIYRARHHIKSFFLIKSFVGICMTILISYILYLRFGPTELNIVIATYLSAILSTAFYAYQNRSMFGGFELKTEFVFYSLTVILGGVMSLLIAYIDIVMIEAMMTKADVGLYKVATELAQLPSFFLRIVNTVFPPLVSKLYHEGNLPEVRRLYERITRYLFVLSSITILIILLLWKPILSLYGVEYLVAKNVLIYRGIGQLVNASVGSVWYIVLMTGHQKIRLISILASALINITLNYLLIPPMGIDGAALASMASTVFINIIGFFVVKKILDAKVFYII
ncbi:MULTISPECIES: polysaccharide biosynthesis C-terminal domain-containing protein [unclassified Fusibacter]|uniref:oligosaccharide flippase family protein n=1 Tax=unclassified Fusibacter TaxID=2624464 RepID=UPI0010107700|nr:MULTISPECIES: polysaccharide biosynthesis C-terminal domain-containing protein [unclassified Fusibacter]MCK8061286.1 polysaccharide biosynthesis C-terminal domain-containing protein [Fusibacter sp. A2]NPE23516.1 oligosaccharide flippase family protein [Fusibacter sp. A1]RXV59120.1 hypothetical protein DWB64_17120 [Fusibacter sp. A1]